MGKMLLAIAAGVLTFPGGLLAAPVYTGPSIGNRAIHDQDFTVDAIANCGWDVVTDTDGMALDTLSEDNLLRNQEGFLSDPTAVPEPETAMLCGAALLTLGLLARRYLPKSRR